MFADLGGTTLDFTNDIFYLKRQRRLTATSLRQDAARRLQLKQGLFITAFSNFPQATGVSSPIHIYVLLRT